MAVKGLTFKNFMNVFIKIFVFLECFLYFQFVLRSNIYIHLFIIYFVIIRDTFVCVKNYIHSQEWEGGYGADDDSLIVKTLFHSRG